MIKSREQVLREEQIKASVEAGDRREEVLKALEPLALAPINGLNAVDLIRLSSAISLKRIADSLDVWWNEQSTQGTK